MGLEGTRPPENEVLVRDNTPLTERDFEHTFVGTSVAAVLSQASPDNPNVRILAEDSNPYDPTDTTGAEEPYRTLDRQTYDAWGHAVVTERINPNPMASRIGLTPEKSSGKSPFVQAVRDGEFVILHNDSDHECRVLDFDSPEYQVARERMFALQMQQRFNEKGAERTVAELMVPKTASHMSIAPEDNPRGLTADIGGDYRHIGQSALGFIAQARGGGRLRTHMNNKKGDGYCYVLDSIPRGPEFLMNTMTVMQDVHLSHDKKRRELKGLERAESLWQALQDADPETRAVITIERPDFGTIIRFGLVSDEDVEDTRLVQGAQRIRY